jgi:hypothetical protein
MFLFWSAFFLLTDPPHETNPSPLEHVYYINPFSFAFLISIGIWRRWAVARYLGIAFTWLWLIGAVGLFLQLFPMSFLKVSGPPILENFSATALRILIVPFFLAQLWQLRVLKRSDVVESFVSEKRLKEILPSLPVVEKR